MKCVNYYPLEIREAEQVVPNTYDLDMARKQGLAQKDIYDGSYLEVRAAYLAVLNQYLCERADLDDYQEILDLSEYQFPRAEETVYFKAGAFGRNNIYIRNNAYVERLEEADLELLQENMRDGEIICTEELFTMIGRTMESVLAVRYEDTDKDKDEVFDVVYDTGLFQCNMAPNNALVLAISYDFEYDENGNIVSEQVEDKKAEIVEELHKRMSDEMSSKLGMPVCVFY